MDILSLGVGAAIGLLMGSLLVVRARAAAAVAGTEREHLRGQVEALSRQNADLTAASHRQASLDTMLKPLAEGLAEVSRAAHDADRRRGEAEVQIRSLIEESRSTTEQLGSATRQLVAAMAKGQSRGQWGEMQLEQLLAHAGLLEGVHYRRQDTRDSGAARPDLVVLLPGGGEVLVDAKFPWDAYFEAMGLEDPAERRPLLQKHAGDLGARVAELSRKQYTATSDVTPDFVVLFLPLEPLLSTALDHDGLLLETAFGKHIILATPTTMLGLLRTIAFAWSRHDLAVNAEEIRSLASTFLERLGTVVDHVNRMGRQLRGGVDAYNAMVASFDTRLVKQAERLTALGVPSPKPLGLSPELANDVTHSRTAPATPEVE